MTEIDEQFAVHESDNSITIGSQAWDASFRERNSYDREKLLIRSSTPGVPTRSPNV
jgi:hypothetical protein